MEPTLLEITKRYAQQFRDFADLLDSVAQDTRSDRIYATHFILQIQHRSANARRELLNLPPQKE